MALSSVDAVTASLRQGSVILGIPAISGFDDGGSVSAIGTDAPHGMVIVSQTCDLVREEARRPDFKASLIRDLEGEPSLSDAQSQASPRWLPLPALGPTYFGDLDVVVTYSKGVLLLCSEIVEGCRSEDDERMLAECLRRNSGRFPFPDDVQRSLHRLRSLFRKRSGKNSAEGRAVDALLTVRVQPHHLWATSGLAVTVHFVFADEWLEASREATVGAPSKQLSDASSIAEAIEHVGPTPELLIRLARAWVGEDAPVGSVAAVDVDVHAESEFTYALLRRSEQLDFDFLSLPDD